MNESEQKICRQEKPPDRITALALIYLGLPFFIFFQGWFEWPWGILLTLVTASGLFLALSKNDYSLANSGPIWLRGYVAIVTVGVTWTLFGGAGHFFYANYDWFFRDAVLRDLTMAHWPPGYGVTDEGPVILRAPIAYFLPSAAIGKLMGVEFADKALWLWTACGTVLFLLLLPLPARLSPRLILGLVIVMFFSGLDLLGMLLINLEPIEAGQHLEWWGWLFQYSSNTTQLFWVPNHALPAWIAIAMFYRHWRHPSFAHYVPITGALLPLWSPFAAIGMAPFYLLWFFNQFKQVKWHPMIWIPALMILLATVPYLALSVHAIPASLTMDSGGVGLDLFVSLYLSFVIFEFILIWLLVYRPEDKILWVSTGIILLVLPFLHFGPGNDIVMRGSIPALMMLCIFTILAIAQFREMPVRRIVLLVGLLLVGAVTPMQEFIRAVKNQPWSPHLDRNLYQTAKNNLPPHYMAVLKPSGLGLVMREPDDLLNKRDSGD
jgi:hypothetical protein